MNKFISNNNIYRLANDIKNHVENGGSGLPNSLNYDGMIYYWYDMMYVMSYAVNHLNGDCTIPNINTPSDAWKGDTINEQVMKNDFLKQASNIVSFVSNNNHTIPNYVTTLNSKKKVNANLYTYCFAKILVYYKNHNNTLPLQCLYNSSDVKKIVSEDTKTDNVVKPNLNTEGNYGYWVFGRDMMNVDIHSLVNNGVTDIFLNYYAFESHGESKVLSWIKNVDEQNIRVHIWVQCFYDGEWHNPKTTNLENKKKEIKYYSGLNGVKGIHLDYLRYPGNAFKTDGGADSITEFVKKVREENPQIILSCAVMPENETKHYYGQDVEALGKIVDMVIPMQYKGNYNGGTQWLATTTENFSKKATIWSGLQSYKSDEDTRLLSATELITDMKNCISNGAKGIVLFRYGLCENINFKNDEGGKMSKFISNNNIYKMATDFKNYVEKNNKLPFKFVYDGIEFFTNEMQDIMTYCLLNRSHNCNCDAPRWCDNATGDTINENVQKHDYLDQAKRVHDYIIKNGQVPNFVTTVDSKKKVDIDLYSFCIAKVLVWYKNHNNTLPNYCLYNSKDLPKSSTTSSSSSNSTASKSNGLNGYLSDKGCRGMGQCTGYNCACNSLQQCFYRLTGIFVDESTIAKWCGTTNAGTSHQGIETGVAQFNKVYGKNVKIAWKNFSELGSSESERWKKLQEYINVGAVFVHLLYRDQWGHYEVPKQVNSNDLTILNSLGDYCSYPAYCGYIETRTKSTQIRYMNGISQKSIAILRL